MQQAQTLLCLLQIDPQIVMRLNLINALEFFGLEFIETQRIFF